MEFQYYWADIAVIVLVLVFMSIGYKNGLLRMVYTLVSFAASILIAWLLYPIVVDLLKGFGLEGTLGGLVRTNYIAPARPASLPGQILLKDPPQSDKAATRSKWMPQRIPAYRPF